MIEWTVITVTFNSEQALATYWVEPIPDNVRWIVVDNASTDASRETAAALGAEVIALPKNFGFSSGNNTGLGVSTSRYVAFVNPDVTIDWHSLVHLAADIDKFDALVAPALRNPDGSPQQNGRGLPFLLDKLGHRGVRLPFQRVDLYLPELRQSITAVTWAMGAALCGRRITFHSIGAWNDSFFIYYEDHEIGLRAWSKSVPVLVDGRVAWVHGWARSTAGFNLRAWRREIASSWAFYRAYPELLLPIRRRAQSMPYAEEMVEWKRKN
jgi:N-acetylglucosaminyl-diphospho-decaprenol L-rhamnosyltransferase